MDPQVKVIAQVIQERKNQDRKWGGPEHDDTHQVPDWLRYLDYQCRKMTPQNQRERFIKIAALAIAAVESLDRKANESQ